MDKPAGSRGQERRVLWCNEGMKYWIAVAILGGTIAVPGPAEEGMWTFDNPPAKLVQEKYHYTLTADWLNHVRLASVA